MSKSPFYTEADYQVRQAIASVTLEGRKPSQRSIELVRAVAEGKVTAEDALETLRSWYKIDSK